MWEKECVVQKELEEKKRKVSEWWREDFRRVVERKKTCVSLYEGRWNLRRIWRSVEE